MTLNYGDGDEGRWRYKDPSSLHKRSKIKISSYFIHVSILLTFFAIWYTIPSFLGRRTVEQYPRNENWKYYYLPTLPSALSNTAWPVHANEKHAINSKISVTTCIPALISDLKKNLPELLNSMQAQTVAANEVLIVLSDVRWKIDEDEGEESNGHDWCYNTWIHLAKRYNRSEMKLLCVGERLITGRARNTLGRLAGSSLLAFIDADDTELPMRNEIIKNIFECRGEKLKLLLHGKVMEIPSKHPYDVKYRAINNDSSPNGFIPASGQCADKDDPIVEVVEAKELYEISSNMIEKEREIGIGGFVHAGHPVVHRSVLEHIKYSSLPHGSDSTFLHDVIYECGPVDGSAMAIKRPLTTYYQEGRRD